MFHSFNNRKKTPDYIDNWWIALDKTSLPPNYSYDYNQNRYFDQNGNVIGITYEYIKNSDLWGFSKQLVGNSYKGIIEIKTNSIKAIYNKGNRLREREIYTYIQ